MDIISHVGRLGIWYEVVRVYDDLRETTRGYEHRGVGLAL